MLAFLLYSILFLLLCPGLGPLLRTASLRKSTMRCLATTVNCIRQRVFLRIVVTVAVLYLAAAPRVSPWLYEHFLFSNRRLRMLDDETLRDSFAQLQQSEQHCAIALSDERWTTSHGELHVVSLSNPAGRFDVVVLISQGIAGNIAGHHQLIELLTNIGVREVVIYEPRGFGKSHFQAWSPALIPTMFGGQEHVSLRSMLEDASEMQRLVARRNNKGRPIIWWGESFGASVVSFLSTHEHTDVSGLVLQGGFKSLADIGYDKPLPGAPFNPCILFPRWLYPREFDTRQWLAGKHAPVLLLHGAHDNIVPIAHSRCVARTASDSCRLVELPHSRHVDLNASDMSVLIDSLVQFLGTLQCAR